MTIPIAPPEEVSFSFKDDEPSVKSVSEFLREWKELIDAPPAPPVDVEVTIYGWRSHFRGRFIHSHKGKRCRQHPLRTQYLATLQTRVLHNVTVGALSLPVEVRAGDQVIVDYPYQP